ncbi:YaaR family protein [Salsuginibacillus kocurii]|uniref:YaaR family protein n=1 Tax=Salsuginibacillus kocurii TaxID=427078 RepID=UPI00037D8E5B|nr:YaaR family protein [Salsuginibacillus kocurii]
MDVQKVGRTGSARAAAKQKTDTQTSVSFQEMMDKRRDEKSHERMTQLMKKIDDQGKVLSETRTVEELRKYKQLVTDFMDEAVQNGLSLEEKRGYNRRGRTKVYKIVEEVDRKLLDLTDAVIKQEKNGLDILDMVGEVRGLLVNIHA